MDKQTTSASRSVAPVKMLLDWRSIVGLSISALIFLLVAGVTFAHIGLSTFSFGSVLLGAVLAFLFLMYLNPGNWQNIPKYHVGKLYLSVGLYGSSQIIAFDSWQRGYKPRLLTPGWNYIAGRIFYQLWVYPWVRVPSRGLGYIISKIGKALPPGQKTGRSLDLVSYEDVTMFNLRHGEMGIQRTILPPSYYGAIDPVAFTVVTDDENGVYGEMPDLDLRSKQNQGILTWKDFPGFAEHFFRQTVIPDGKQGIVTILDGEPVPARQLVHRFGGWHDIQEILEQPAEYLAGDDNFNKLISEAKTLPEKRQVELFKLLRNKKEELEKAWIGECGALQDAEDVKVPKIPTEEQPNIPTKERPKIPTKEGVAEQSRWFGETDPYDPRSDIFRIGRKRELRLCLAMLKKLLRGQLGLHNSYQDLECFFGETRNDKGEITKKPGLAGPQWDTLPPGVYNLNCMVVQVKVADLLVVEEGHVAVLKSGIGMSPDDITHRRFKFGAIVRPGQVGIWLTPLWPGTYLLNTDYIQRVDVVTAMLVLFWGPSNKAILNLDEKLLPVKTITKDGYQDITLNIDAQLVIPAESAAIVIATFGSIKELINGYIAAKLHAFTVQVVRLHDLSDLIEHQNNVQEEILEKFKKELAPYEIHVMAVLIQEIDGAEEYLNMREQRINAQAEIQTVKAQAEVQVERRELESKRAEADRAAELMFAEVDTIISTKANESMKNLLKDIEGVRGQIGEDAAKKLADGLSRGLVLFFRTRAVGKSRAAVMTVIEDLANAGIDVVSKVNVGGQGSILDALLGAGGLLATDDEWAKKIEGVVDHLLDKKEERPHRSPGGAAKLKEMGSVDKTATEPASSEPGKASTTGKETK